jgi:hypothetical protein
MQSQVIDLSSSTWVAALETIRHDVYHLPEYFYIEAKRTKTIPEAIFINEGAKTLFVPYLLRNCDDIFTEYLTTDDIFDIISPYGYTGILLSEEAASEPDFIQSALEQLKAVLSAKNVCSAFLRMHPILNQNIQEFFPADICQVMGETVSINLENSPEKLWQETRSQHRNKINQAKRLGITVRFVPYDDYLEEFISIYTETMNRIGATSIYYFDSQYYDGLRSLGDKLHLCIVEWENQVICASLFFEVSGIVQYHLSGTRTEFLKQSPNIFLLDYVRHWAKERGNQFFHLGGGLGAAKDSLHQFKSGFSKQRHNFSTLRWILDAQKYAHLVKLRAKSLNTQPEGLLESNFFPAYRAS